MLLTLSCLRLSYASFNVFLNSLVSLSFLRITFYALRLAPTAKDFTFYVGDCLIVYLRIRDLYIGREVKVKTYYVTVSDRY